VGEAVRDLYLHRKPNVDVSVFDVKRFGGAFQRTELNIIWLGRPWAALFVRKAEDIHPLRRHLHRSEHRGERPGHRLRRDHPLGVTLRHALPLGSVWQIVLTARVGLVAAAAYLGTSRAVL
jgi:hypothetical protein